MAQFRRGSDILIELEAAKSEPTQHGSFIPYSKFNDIIKGPLSGVREFDRIKSLIEDTYQKYFSHYEWTIEQVKRKIVPNGLKIYIAMMLANQEDLLSNFLERDKLNDALLPFDEQDLQNILPDIKEYKRQVLLEKMMLFSAPELEDQGYSRFIKARPLPFLAENFLSSQGSNGIISEVIIPFEYLKASEKNSVLPQNYEEGEFPPYKKGIKRLKLIRKKVLNPSSEEKMELETLRQLPRHDSVISLFYSFSIYDNDRTQLESLNMLFPKYDQTLLQFLSRDNPDGWTINHFIRAFSQLADGLAQFSSPRSKDRTSNIPDIATHNDIKPGNIMVDEIRHKLVLIDFGSAKIEYNLASSDDAVVFRNSYTAPEILSNTTENSHGLKRDIWALGCILTEVIVYLHKPSADTINNFKNNLRQKEGYVVSKLFHSLNFQTGSRRLHPEVEHALQSISESSHSQALRYTVPVVRQILQIDPSNRPDAETVATKLRHIADETEIPGSEAISTGEEPDEICGVRESLYSLQGDTCRPLEANTQNPKSHATGEYFPIEISEKQLPPFSSDILERQAQALSNFVRAGNGMRSKEDWIPARAKALWKRSKNGYCINIWASKPFSSVVIIYNDESDNRKKLVEITSIIAARIVEDARQLGLGYHVLYHFFENANIQSQDRVLQLASSLFIQLTKLDESATQRHELIQILESKEISKIMDGFIKMYKKLPSLQRVIMVLDQVVGPGMNAFEKIADVICPLIEMIRQTSRDQNGPACAPLKLFISLPYGLRNNGISVQKWGVKMDETVFNRKDPFNDRSYGFKDIFWENHHLPWFAG